MKSFVLLLSFLSALLIQLLLWHVGAVGAQTPPVLDVTKGHFEWQFDPVGGGTPDEFHLKCGLSTAVYNTTAIKPYVNAPSKLYTMTVAQALPNASPTTTTYFCVVAASNEVGEGLASNEVSFRGGKVPNGATAGTFKVLPN